MDGPIAVYILLVYFEETQGPFTGLSRGYPGGYPEVNSVG